jgi:uncharacterized protein (UPF0218 family)
MSTASTPSVFDESFPERDLVLPDGMREELARPIGTMVSEGALEERLAGSPRVISVGDVVTATLLRMGVVPDVAVFDYRTQRADERASKSAIAGMDGRLVKVENPPGRITKGLWKAVKEAVKAKDTVKVEVSGEEDLAALVAIVNAPEGAQVIYGIPNKGLMVVRVDEGSRALASDAVKRMTR